MSAATQKPAPATRGQAPAVRYDIAEEQNDDGLLARAGARIREEVREAGVVAHNSVESDEHTFAELVEQSQSRSHNIVGAAVTLGLSVIMLILMAIVAGYFVTQAPSNGAFSGAIDQVEDVGGTAFILLAVALLAVPVVAIVGYFMNSGLGGFIGSGRMRR